MAGILDKPIWSADGLTLSNVLLPVTNLYATYNVITEWYDGTPMDDSKLDTDLVYVKFEDKYLLRNMDYGQVLQKDTMAQMRLLSTEEILLLRLGVYKHVQLNGYYVKEDTPAPINYVLSNTASVDDGGSVIVVVNIKLEHKFIGYVYLENFGVMDNGTDVTSLIKVAFEYASDNKLTLKGSKGKVYIVENLLLQNLSNFIVDCECVFKRQDNLPAYPSGSTMLNATSTMTFSSFKNVYVKNINFDGNAKNNNCLTTGTETGSYNWGNYFQEFRHCLVIDNNSAGLTFDNITTDNPSGDGVYIVGENTNNIYIKNISGQSLNADGSVFPVGRNLLSLIQGYDYTIDNIHSDGIGHSTMPSGFDIEPNNNQSVKNVTVGNYYNRCLGTSGLGITTKYGNGINIQDVYLKTVYIDNQKTSSSVRSVVVTGATNVTIDNLYIKGSKSSYALHVGIAGEMQPVFNLNIKNAVIDTCQYGVMADNLTNGYIKSNVINCYENMYRIYSVKDFDFNITGNFASDIDTSGIKNFGLYFNVATNGQITNCNFSGDLSLIKTGFGLGHRAVTANNILVSQINKCALTNLNLDGWSRSSKIVGDNLKIKQSGISKTVNRGNAASVPELPEVFGQTYWNDSTFSWQYWNSSRWRPVTTNGCAISSSAEPILTNEGGLQTWENNYTGGECVLTIPLSARYSVGTVFILRNNQLQNVRLRGEVGVTIQSNTNHNAVIMSSVNDVVILYCSAANTWRYVKVTYTLSKMNLITDSTATDVAGVNAKLNSLIAEMKNKGFMSNI